MHGCQGSGKGAFEVTHYPDLRVLAQLPNSHRLLASRYGLALCPLCQKWWGRHSDGTVAYHPVQVAA